MGYTPLPRILALQNQNAGKDISSFSYFIMLDIDSGDFTNFVNSLLTNPGYISYSLSSDGDTLNITVSVLEPSDPKKTGDKTVGLLLPPCSDSILANANGKAATKYTINYIVYGSQQMQGTVGKPGSINPPTVKVRDGEGKPKPLVFNIIDGDTKNGTPANNQNIGVALDVTSGENPILFYPSTFPPNGKNPVKNNGVNIGLQVVTTNPTCAANSIGLYIMQGQPGDTSPAFTSVQINYSNGDLSGQIPIERDPSKDPNAITIPPLP